MYPTPIKACFRGTVIVVVPRLWYERGGWRGPFLGPFSCAGWDALVCYAIVNNAKVRMIGVTTAPEVFHQIIQSKFANVACISPAGRAKHWVLTLISEPRHKMNPS